MLSFSTLGRQSTLAVPFPLLHPRTHASPHPTHPRPIPLHTQSDAVAKRIVRTSCVNRFIRRLTRRLGPIVFEEPLPHILCLISKAMAQLLWQRRVGEASAHAKIRDLESLVADGEREASRLRAILDDTAVGAYVNVDVDELRLGGAGLCFPAPLLCTMRTAGRDSGALFVCSRGAHGRVCADVGDCMARFVC
jgi:hypothetical protein